MKSFNNRSLGVHFSKVRSLTLDSWEPELLKVTEFIHSFIQTSSAPNLPYFGMYISDFFVVAGNKLGCDGLNTKVLPMFEH